MEKFKAIKIASIFGVFGNIFLLIIKGIVGFFTGSYAMIADSMNSAGDILSSVLTYVGNRISSKPRDDDHNLGHGKAEYIYSLFISIIIILMSYEVLSSSIKALINGERFTFSIWLIIVCIVTIIIKFLLYLYTKILYKKYDNILIKANSMDHRNDCFVTFANLIACICAIFNIFIIDSIVGIGISIWIIISALRLFKESYDVLMDKSMDVKTKNKVLEIINNHKEIYRINHFNATPVGYQYQISFTIFVDGNLSTFESHDIANRLEKEIDKKVEEVYLTVIHVNPIDKKM